MHQGTHLGGEPGPAGCGQAIGFERRPATCVKATLDPTLVNLVHLLLFRPSSTENVRTALEGTLKQPWMIDSRLETQVTAQ